ncbi:MAG: hypothetical protein ACSHXF_09180 [Aquaticitalea sp.]
MKHIFLQIIFCLLCIHIHAQREFHVTTNGKSSGNGSINNPWDLQTALSQKPEVVNGDDTIWLHGGIYKGRFLSSIQSTKEDKYITVAPYNEEKVVLNGNVDSKLNGVLNVRGNQVIFRDFEITWLGDFSRDANDKNFAICAGISHTGGENCRFYNLIIHNNPGLGIGSWKHASGTIIENCMIYHNGYIAQNGKGIGEGIYVQNKSDKTRLIKNNVIFSNYYKGIEVWSAGRKAAFEYVKNIKLEGNIIFNSGGPSGNHYDNVIVATDDRNGINMAKNIQILNNVFYHNTDYLNNEVNGDAPSLTIGYVDNTPAEDITVKDNIILGRNNALRILHVKSINLIDNIVYGGYVILSSSEMQYSKDWNLNNNLYFTKKNAAFRIHNTNRNLKFWQSTYNLDMDSQWQHIKEFDLRPILSISELRHISKTYSLSLFNKSGHDVEVDFSNYDISQGETYQIYDVENRNKVFASGIVNASKKIIFSMNSTEFEKPLHNEKAQKTPSNFGVFLIRFEDEKTTSTEELSDFEKILKWMGF